MTRFASCAACCAVVSASAHPRCLNVRCASRRGRCVSSAAVLLRLCFASGWRVTGERRWRGAFSFHASLHRAYHAAYVLRGENVTNAARARGGNVCLSGMATSRKSPRDIMRRFACGSGSALCATGRTVKAVGAVRANMHSAGITHLLRGTRGGANSRRLHYLARRGVDRRLNDA